jgi:hypothetical protein
MATPTKFNQYVADVHNGVHNLGGNALMVALLASANAPVVTKQVLADLVQINYANLSSRAITVRSSLQVSGTYNLILEDLSLSATGPVATFRYVVIYNDTPTSPTDPLICYIDNGADVTMGSGDVFLIDLSQVSGLIQGT